MNKLLRKYHADPSLANALKVKAYALRHPMVCCMLNTVEHLIYQAAMAKANEH